jgi:sporulation protein YlmC with PRC-barrel domain
MKTKNIVLAAFGLCLSAAVVAEHNNNGYLFVSKASAAAPMPYSTQADMQKLIGTNIKNPAGDTVGEVKSVRVDAAGKISAVIVSVGGFLGVGDREVAIAWNDINVTEDGKSVTTPLTKDNLEAMPEYKYRATTLRGTIFRDE